MNLAATLKLLTSADSLGPGAVGVSTPAQGVVSPSMRKRRGLTQVAADASPSDLASHHTWLEPSSTDTTILHWRAKRELEKRKGRNLDPFEADAELEMEAQRGVTGPCGCTLQVGERVLAEGYGRGTILSRSNRLLMIGRADGTQRQVDQRLVHRLKG
jgi:hypothetical protein